MDRVEVLNKINASRTRLEAALARLTPEQMMNPDLPAGWSVKDLLAHLGRWEQHAVDIFGALTTGADPHSPMNEDEVDAFNATTMELFHARSLDEVREFEQTAFRSLVKLVETIPEADLFEPQRFAWTRGRPFVTWVGWNTYDHYAEHLPALESRLAEERDGRDQI